MSVYDLVFILSENKEDLLNKIETIIQTNKGKILTRNDWGKKTFSYKIKKLSTGHYFFWQIEIPASNVLPFKKSIAYEELMIRYLLLKKDKHRKKL